MRSRVAARLPALATGIGALALAAGCGGEESNPAVEPEPAFGDQPNFVLVLTDDQNLASYERRTMPRTSRLLAGPGTTFTRYVDATPLCCPSRAALLTGQYGHNNGVLNNVPGYSTLREPDNVLPVWLQRAGYRTANVGKFLNGYERAVDDNKEVAPGWDEWQTLVGKHSFYDFKFAVSGEERKVAYRDGPYLTDELNRRATELVRELSGPQPFFLQLAHLAPHVENGDSGGPCGGDTVPAPRDLGRFAGEPLPDSPALNERPISDKPPFVSGLPPISAGKRSLAETRWRCRLESLGAVDRGIAQLVRTLRAEGELDETVIVFTSDNGTFHGEHRLPGGKGLPYAEAAELPLVIRVPERYRGGGTAPARVSAPVANVDLAPTIVEWAGTETCPEEGDCLVMDGRSLLPLLGAGGGWPANRPILTELDIGKEQLAEGRGISCRYEGVRQGRWLYVAHSSIPDLATGECEDADVLELYDHARDPFELDNLAAAGAFATGEYPEPALRRLERVTDELADCAGIEGRDPEPDSGHYCR
jgi:N-acetylglucosamine-6-sulfatase